MWSESGIAKYRDIVCSSLKHIQDTWLESPTVSALHVALQATNSVMEMAACMTNKSIQHSKPFVPRSAGVPKEIKSSQRALLKIYRQLRNFTGAHKEHDLVRTQYT